MILTIDVGNTNIVLGAFEEQTLIFSARCATDRGKTEDEYALIFQGILAMHGVRPDDVEGGILSSVVPVLRAVVPKAFQLLAKKRMLVVDAKMQTDLNIRIQDPSQLGTDRIVDAVAALHMFPPPIVILDMGTATTLSVIDRDKNYLGGMIMPGLRVSVDSLSARTAQLPQIDFGPPSVLIGRNTVECMHAGAIYGCAAMMDGLIERVERELGQAVSVVLTGGLAPVVAPFCLRNVHLQPDLQLLGLRLLYEKNRKI